MSQSPSKSSPISWLLFVGGGLLLALLTGRLAMHLVPDSASYLAYSFRSWDEICRSIRTPLYPLWLSLFRSTVGIEMVPVGQVIIHATAAWWLYCELGAWEMPRPQRSAAAIAISVGCTATDHINVISTDAIGASFGVIAATSTLRWARLGDRPATWLPMVAAATMAIFLRPAYLFLIPWMLVAGAMLRNVKGASWRSAIAAGFKVSLIALLPVVGWMMLRQAVVRDFAILPFGHQNLAAILVQIISEDELADIDPELGVAINQRRQQFDDEVGLAPGAPGATMTIDARWDDMTYPIVVAAAQKLYGDDTVTYHRQIGRLNRAIMKRYPLRYAKWLAQAARRGAWAIAADIVMHPLFLCAISIAVLATLKWSLSGCAGSVTLERTDALRALTIVTWTYVIGKVGFVILTSPPIGRFSDAAAIFIPAWLAVVFVELAGRRRVPSASSWPRDSARGVLN